jgi:hypothetical protein
MKSTAFIAILAAAAAFGPAVASATPPPVPVHRTTTIRSGPVMAAGEVATPVQEQEYESRETVATDLEGFHGGADEVIILAAVLLVVLLLVLI